MCLLIHKPKDIELPPQLLDSAVEFNPHGFGFMSFDANGQLVIRRRYQTSRDELNALYEEFKKSECVIHLRYGTSGVIDAENTHPIRITDDIYMAHNGTINMNRHTDDRSDTWHLVHDYLEPILRNRPELLHDRFFHELVTSWCGPQNKFVFMDAKSQKTVVINREQGFEIEGLWLSNLRWFDISKFNWIQPRIPLATHGPQALFSI
ncbi:MAG: hypothetical protein V4628_16545 [Pseudomonadota bacterium]